MSIIDSHIDKANRITLKNIVNKTSVTLSHQFADVTARDAYFVTNPTELVEDLFIKVGTGYQQYLNSAWADTTAVLVEQPPASLQKIDDAGNYYTIKNTEGALQTVGAQINSLDAEKADQIEVNATNLRIDNLVIPISPENANVEVTDAHNSLVKNKNFTSLKARLEESE